MECPHCGKPVEIDNRAFFNADQYSNRVMVRTNCCGRGVWLTPVRSYRVAAYVGKDTADDWGVPIKVVK